MTGWAWRGVTAALPLWIADQVRNDVTMLRIVFTLTLVLSHQGRGDSVRLVCHVVAPRHEPPLWIADQVRNDVTMRCIVFTLTFDSSPIKGEGI